MTAYTLAPLGDRTWQWLRDLDLGQWLWLDNNGVHLEPLPQSQPLHATHLWGWTAGKAFARIRLDPDLPGGMVGALLRCDDAIGESREAVQPVIVEGVTWSANDGRIAADLPPGLRKSPKLTIYQVRRATGWATSAPLIFIADLRDQTRGDAAGDPYGTD